jgi:hypothetical protein
MWQSFRERSLARFYRVQHEAIHGVKPRAEFRFNDAYYEAKKHGLDLASCSKHWDSVRNSDYSEQKGYPSQMDHEREWFRTERAALGVNYPFIGGVAVRPKATPELIREGVKMGIDAFALVRHLLRGKVYVCRVKCPATSSSISLSLPTRP